MKKNEKTFVNSPAFSVARLEQAIAGARMRGAGRFSLRDVLAMLGNPPSSPELENRIVRLLDADESLFLHSEEKIAGKPEFFTGRTFLLTPDEFEIANGILIPGHRTAGFVSPEVFPSEVTLKEKETGRVFAVKDFTAQLDVIYRYYLLLGTEQFMDYLEADNPANESLTEAPPERQRAVISCFDLGKFYREKDFRPGDALAVTVLDYDKGVLELRYLAASARNKEAGKRWSDAFADALEDVLTRFEHYFDIPEQLAWAFFLGEETLSRRPEDMLSGDEFIRETDRIEIRYQDDRSMLGTVEDDAPSGEDDREYHADDDMDGCCHHPHLLEEVRISRGETEDFARMLKELGFALTPVEVDSYILDSCSFRAPDYGDFFRRCFGGEKIDFADDAQEAVFHNMVEERWETFTSDYDRESDREKAELRGQILELLDEKTEFFSSLDSGDEIAPEKRRKLDKIFRSLDDILRLLNSPRRELENGEAENIGEQIADLGDQWDNWTGKIQSQPSDF